MDAFNLGDSYRDKFVVTDDVVNKFADFSSDFNPIHIDLNYAKSRGYPRQVSHGVIQLSFLSKMIGMNFPGPGSIWIKQTVDWLQPVLVGDTIEIVLTIKGRSPSTKILTLSVEIFNENNKKVMEGESQVKITENLSSQLNDEINKPIDFDLSQDAKEYLSNKHNSTKRVALITGASRGIGEAIARRLSCDGFSVAINCRNDVKSAKTIVDSITSAGGDAIFVQADITSPNDIARMSKKIYSKWGRCDIVIHGASPPIKPIKTEKVRYEDFDLYLNTYLKGSVLLVEAFSKSMIQNNFGRFVFLGSSYLYGAPPQGVAAYVTAKEALWGYTKSLASDMGHYGITANMVSPSLTITDLTSEIPVRVKEVEAMKSPMRRLVTVEDTAYHVAHLCSDYSGYLNGINLPITSSPV
jgi:3-oxoacyl-[acyl-carrier protein] reductase